MQGRGAYFLDRALRSIPKGTPVIVSIDCKPFPEMLGKVYECDPMFIRNQRTRGTAANLNNAIDHVSEGIIKVLFQDDECCNLKPFEDIKDWGFCTSAHNTDRDDHLPYHPPTIKQMVLGMNTYGSPSAMAFRKCGVWFDEQLKWLLDCEFYAKMTLKFGPPQIIDSKVYITEWEGMATHTICSPQVRDKEFHYLSDKYAYL